MPERYHKLIWDILSICIGYVPIIWGIFEAVCIAADGCTPYGDKIIDLKNQGDYDIDYTLSIISHGISLNHYTYEDLSVLLADRICACGWVAIPANTQRDGFAITMKTAASAQFGSNGSLESITGKLAAQKEMGKEVFMQKDPLGGTFYPQVKRNIADYIDISAKNKIRVDGEGRYIDTH